MPYYGLFVEVDNNTASRSIYVYAGGIVGQNNNALAYCSVEDVYIKASSTHDFGGNKTTLNKNYVYVGGICGYNTNLLGYCIAKYGTKLTSIATSIYNPQTTVNPYILSYAGGIVAKNNYFDKICCVESNVEIVHNDAILDCESGWGEHYNNHHVKSGTYIPGYTKSQLDKITSKESVESHIADIEPTHTIILECLNNVCEVGIDNFNTEYIKILVDGIEKKYEIIDLPLLCHAVACFVVPDVYGGRA